MTMLLRIITPEKTLFSAGAEMVTVPGTEGDFGVLPGHMPFLSSLRPGVIEVMRADAAPLRIAVIEGIAEATPEQCTILAESARSLEGVSHAEAQVELRAAEEAAEHAVSEEQQKSAGKKLRMAQVMANAL